MIPRLPRRDCRRAFGTVFSGFDAQDARTEPRPIVALDDMTSAGFDDPIGKGSLSGVPTDPVPVEVPRVFVRYARGYQRVTETSTNWARAIAIVNLLGGIYQYCTSCQ
jgi:hypothetical protein